MTINLISDADMAQRRRIDAAEKRLLDAVGDLKLTGPELTALFLRQAMVANRYTMAEDRGEAPIDPALTDAPHDLAHDRRDFPCEDDAEVARQARMEGVTKR